MSLSRSMRVLLKEAERASKRHHFDPSTVTKPKRPWLDIAVGEHFDVPSSEASTASIRTSAYYWSQKTGRVFSTSVTEDGCRVTRTA